MPAFARSAALPAEASIQAIVTPPLFGGDGSWPKGSAQLVARDAALYAEGDAAQNWFRLLSGSMRVVRMLRDGRRHIGEFVFPGQFFGLEWGPVHSQGAEAIEPSSVVAYPLDRIEQRMAEDAGARQTVRDLLMERLAAAQERVMMLGRLNACGRLAAFLLTMAQRKAKITALRAMPLVADLPMSRVDIADYLGLTVETVSRLFTALRGRNTIRLATANKIEILDPAGLESACAGTVEAEEDTPLARCA